MFDAARKPEVQAFLRELRILYELRGLLLTKAQAKTPTLQRRIKLVE
jgi:hypothetical protein